MTRKLAVVKAYEEQDITVWRKIREVEETCNLGCSHKVSYWARKVLGPVVDHRTLDNGYERVETPVRRDRQGRTYHQHQTVDYAYNIDWRRDDDGLRFVPKPRGLICKDAVTGNLLTRSHSVIQ